MVDEVELTGHFVRLVPLRLSHVEGLVHAAREERETYSFTTVPSDVPSMERYVEKALAEQSRGWALPFAVERDADGRIIGTTRYLDLDDFSPPGAAPSVGGESTASAPRAVEIGATWYAHSVQRTAVNTETKLLLLRHAFATWRVERVSFKTDERNERSRRAIERLGARFEGVRRAHTLGADGAIRNSAYYSILRSEWPDVERNLEHRLESEVR